MNKVELMGRLTRDPDVRYSQGENQMAIARFTLAVDRKFKRDNEQSADFINIIAFGKSGDFAERYLKKGIKIALVGHIQTGNYTDKNGNTVYTTDVVAEEIEFAESKNASSQNNNGFNQINAPVPTEDLPIPPSPASGFKPISNDMPFMNVPQGVDDELPFAPLTK